MKYIKKIISNIIDAFYPSFLYEHKSYSQEGEDVVLNSFFQELYPKNYKGFYVDVGAHHPIRFSNTALFYKKKWQGINIEATPTLLKAFFRFRKRDINLNIAIGNADMPLTFYLFNEPALNTFNKELALSRNGEKNYIIDEQKIPLLKLSTVLDQHMPSNQPIDILDIDVEGFDLEVLKSNNWEKYIPLYIIIETEIDFDNLCANEIHNYLKEKKYKLIAKTQRNCIYQLSL